MEKEFHFLQEIREQPDALRRTLSELDGDLRGLAERLAPVIQQVVFVGCGDPHMLSIAAVYAFEKWAKVKAEAVEAAEFVYYRSELIDSQTLVVLVTSSGKTVKVIDAARIAARKGAPTFALTNLPDGPITKETGTVIQTRAGWSDSFSTKQTVTALAALYALALHWSEVKGSLPPEEITALRSELYERVPEMVCQTLELQESMHALADEFLQARIFTFIGSGPNLSTALLSAAKMKENSQSTAEASNLEEYAHLHHLSLRDGDPVFLLTARGPLDERNRLICEHVEAHGGRLVVVGTEQQQAEWKDIPARYIAVPDHTEMYGPLVAWIPLQFFSYFVSTGLGRNPDRPPKRGPMDFIQKIIYTSMLEGWDQR